MNTDESKTRTELLNELKESRQRLVQAEAVEKGLKREVEKSAHLASFPELNPNPVLELDQKGNIKYTNPATIRLFPDLATLGTKHPFLVDWTQVVKELQGTKWGEAVVRDVVVESSVYEQIVSPLAENQIHIYGRNITRRKKAEEALRSSEAWFSTTLRSIGDAVIATDEKAYVKLMNSVAQALTGWNEKDAIGKPLGDVFNIVNEETGKKAENPVARVIREGVVVGLANHTALIGKDGTKWSIDDSGAPIKDDKGNIIGTVLVFRDVTERRKMEHNLNERLKELGCVYGIASIAERPGITLDEIYQETVELFPQGWQYPEVACAHLIIYGKEFKTANYRETEWKQSVDIKVHGINAGMVEVGYLEERPASDEGPFLKEERLLIGAIADRLGRITERIQAEKQVEHLNLVLRAIRNVNQLITREKDRHELIRKACDTLIETRGYLGAWLAVTDESGKPVAYSESGWGKDFLSLAERLEHGELTICGRKALKQRGVVITSDPSTECADCPVSSKCAGKGVMTAEMEYADRVWGILSVAIPIRMIDDEETILFREVVQDIAFALHDIEIDEQRKRAEEALRQSEEKYRTVLEEIEEGYYELDLAGNWASFNDTFCDTLGYSREELTGMNYRAVTFEEDIDTAFKVFEEAYRTGKLVKDLSFRAVCKDGSIRLIEAVAFPMRNEEGDIIGFRGIGRDVTERKQAEEALRQSEEKYRTILKEMEDSYFEVDLAGNLTFFNDSTSNRLGYSAEELMGMSYREFTASEDIKLVYKVFNEVYRTNRANKGFLWKVVRKDRTVGFVEATVSPLQNPKGEIIGFRGVGRDITERKLLEAEKEEIEQKAEVASRLASIGEMASGIAHEINNPLTGVIGYAQLLSKKELPEDIKEGLEVINDGAQRVAVIIKRLLTFARQYKPERTIVNVNNIIETTLSLRSYHLKTSNIKLTTQLAPDLPVTIADAGQLQQVFLNLIVNAEVEMKQAHGKGKLSVRTEQMDNIIRISFKDDGPGIMKKNLERIFNPFFTTRRVGEGTGLGLSVCHGIIAEHGGRIYAESKLGRGATFVIELPVVTEVAPPKPAKPVVKKSKKAAKARILVVDDEKVIRDIVNLVLTGEGHEVEAVDNAADALKKIEGQKYSLILLDIKMPDMSGIELYERIQKIDKSLAHKVVFITGDIMGADTEKFLYETKVAHIDKPFDVEQLSREVQRALTAGR